MVSISRRLSSELAEIPDRLLPSLRRGFDVASHLAEGDLSSLARSTIERFGPNRETVEPEPIAERFDISVSDARDLVLAMSMMVATVLNGDEEPREFILAGVEGKLFDEKTGEVFGAAVEEIALQRSMAKERMSEARLAAAVIPSFDNVTIAVDIRVSVDSNKVVRWVPVLLMHVETDIFDEEVRMQLSHADAKKMSDEIKKGLELLEAAETWAQSRRDGVKES